MLPWEKVGEKPAPFPLQGSKGSQGVRRQSESFPSLELTSVVGGREDTALVWILLSTSGAQPTLKT